MNHSFNEGQRKLPPRKSNCSRSSSGGHLLIPHPLLGQPLETGVALYSQTETSNISPYCLGPEVEATKVVPAGAASLFRRERQGDLGAIIFPFVSLLARDSPAVGRLQNDPQWSILPGIIVTPIMSRTSPCHWSNSAEVMASLEGRS